MTEPSPSATITRPDIIVVGGGSNSLTTACYLAKAGLSVLVLERNAEPGGGVVSIETAPGFVHDTHAMGFMTCLGNPAIRNDELGLASRFGLRWAYKPAPFATLLPDGRGLISYTDVDATCAEIARHSPADAEAYRAMVGEARELLPLLMRSFYAPPIPQAPFEKLLLASEKGRRLAADMAGSVMDILDARFSSPLVKVHFAKWASEMMVAPDRPGTGLALSMLLGLSHQFEMGTVVGGARNLTRALVACLEAHGGELRTGTTVSRLVMRGNRCVGVELEGGETIEARRAVVANIHPWNLRAMVPTAPDGVCERAAAVKLSEFGAINQQVALAEKPLWKAGDRYEDATVVECLSPDWEAFLTSFEAFREKRMPLDHLGPVINIQSNVDPSRAPEGRAALYLYHFAPFEIEGGWDAARQPVADAVWDWFASFTTNMDASKILARHIETPPDHAAHSRIMMHGDIMGIAMTADQSLGARPTPELSNYRVPGIEQLYLAGCTTHPGGTVTLGGRATAMKIYMDMGINLGSGFTNW